MATQTFEELIAGANKIKDNELPESNTHNLVGDQLLQMTNKMQEENSNNGKKFSELEKVQVVQPINIIPNSWVDENNEVKADVLFDLYEFDVTSSTIAYLYVATGGGYIVIIGEDNSVLSNYRLPETEETGYRYANTNIRLDIPASAITMRVTQAKNNTQHPKAYPLKVMLNNKKVVHYAKKSELDSFIFSYTGGDGYIDKNGEIDLGDGRFDFKHKVTPIIACKEGDVFGYKGYGYADGPSCLFYRDDKIISTQTINSTTAFTDVTIGKGIDGVKFASYTTDGSDPILDVNSDYFRASMSDVENINTELYDNLSLIDVPYIKKIINNWVNADNIEAYDSNFDIYDFNIKNATLIKLFAATGGGYIVMVNDDNEVIGEALRTPGNDRYVSKWIEIKVIDDSATKLRVTQAKQNLHSKAYPLRVLMNNQDNGLNVDKNNVLFGKKVLFIGDSITDTGYYINSIVAKTACIAYNRGASGTTVAINDTVENSMCERLDKEPNDTPNAKYDGFPTEADYVFLFGGINDWGKLKNQELGDFNAAIDNTTFIGALKYMYRGLKTKYPNAKIYAINLLHTYSPNKFPAWSELNYEDSDETKAITINANTSSKTLYDYRDAISKCASMYGIPIIDMFEVGFTATLDNDRTLYYTDGLHPNELGGQMMCNLILSKIVE